jgi:hypothetical protein
MQARKTKTRIKFCKGCGLYKDLTEDNFIKRMWSKSRAVFSPFCLLCDPDGTALKDVMKERRAKELAWHRDPSNKSRFRGYQLKRSYGISWEDRRKMLLLQNNACLICKAQEGSKEASPKHGGKLYIDHCHATGRVRGLLCHLCNQGLGLFRDNPEFLENAIYYLNKGGLGLFNDRAPTPGRLPDKHLKLIKPESDKRESD